jgi:hypothetical protein
MESIVFSRPAGRVLLGLALAAGSHAAVAQNASTPSNWEVKPGELIYLDGQPSTLVAINQVPDDAVACVEGMTGKPGVLRAFGNETATDVLVITTKAQENSPTTLALADRVDLRSAYRWEAATLRDVAPRALAYITAHYPKHRLDGVVQKLTRKSSGEVKYQVRLADNWGWSYPCFTAEGDFVGEKMP